MNPFSTTVVGYPRVGRDRHYKRLLERFWNGQIAQQEFISGIRQLRIERLQTQAAAGIDLVPCGDFSLYDHVLDTAVMLGCIPARFGWAERPVSLQRYFIMARGGEGQAPCEMTKWFDTNYHYLVPELPERFQLTSNWLLDALRIGREVVGERAKPVLLGPYSFLRLARLTDAALAQRLEELTPIYQQILAEVFDAGAQYVQLDEPALAGDCSRDEWAALEHCYRQLGAFSTAPSRGIILQTSYQDVAARYVGLCALPIAGLGLDFVHGQAANLAAFRAHRFPSEKLLVAGVVNGRGIWRSDLDATLTLVQELAQTVAPERLLLSSSCTLLHLPETVVTEQPGTLPDWLRGGLCFAQERLGELRLLAAALRDDSHRTAEPWRHAQAARERWLHAPERRRPTVRDRVAALQEQDFTRLPYAERLPLQQERLPLPLLPTTTIGSFPQTTELRRARVAAQQDPAPYQAIIEAEIRRVVALQEELGIDVLVHGEPERNDMVQFFAEQLAGYAFTQEGWVQSYGSRCVRPPIIFGDIERTTPMTLTEARFAQSLTSKPVKGMLTGPITMLRWSFVREDLPAEQVAYQLALAIRDEAVALERDVGLRVIQIDEPAIREGLPLRRVDWAEYLRWAVQAFRLATAGVAPATQIHTHMCYSEFGEIIEAIAALDADVISIEDARSDGAMLQTLRDFAYPQQIGPGVYDIHSINIPTVEQIVAKLRATLARVPIDQVWVNPDCGMKTRGYAEIIPALRNIVAAVQQLRAEVANQLQTIRVSEE